jgi:hypothetical protein
MDIEYNWKAKKLKEDDFGDATTLILAMTGIKDGVTKTEGLAISFGGDDIKAQSDWTDAEIDTWAETHRTSLETAIALQFNS